jgi:hypothetical protein
LNLGRTVQNDADDLRYARAATHHFGDVMANSKRALRRAKRRAEQQADAEARMPALLAQEQALRDDLTALTRRARALRKHAEYDRAIHELTARGLGLLEGLRSTITQLNGATASVTLRRIRNETATDSCCHLHRLIIGYEQQLADVQVLSTEFVDLVERRASLGTQQTNTEDVARSIEAMAAHIANIQAGLERYRTFYAAVCPPEMSDPTS